MSEEKKPFCLSTKPNEDSPLLNSDKFLEDFNLLNVELTTKEAFLSFLHDHKNDNIVAIYGGFPQFTSIGGLTKEIIEHEDFPQCTLKCIVLCSRGYNMIDIKTLKKFGIQLYNYQDEVDESIAIETFKVGQVGNDVADCAMWHVLEGFRKFSYQQSIIRKLGNTNETRANIANKTGYVFGHEYLRGQSIRSPRGKKCLVLGLGSIGKHVALKLQDGLGMDIHYCKRTEDLQVKEKYGWKFHPLDDSLYSQLFQFKAIVVALPGTAETKHLINEKFLAHCDGPELVLVNLGRGQILDIDAVTTAFEEGQLRHFGGDVFYEEPKVNSDVLKMEDTTSVTPHVASATVEVFEQACELALTNIIRSITEEDNESPDTECFSRVV
ncbi:putative hydroxyacid dehydrogenase NDAI_0G03410 [Naumovozyma dairenensis CBS 421]|uniref:D-isomer specific 2-hydroxyacid dehydrogenase NAD-binding domain-containing protein n=1 Tax=Naumovozyma dairenensis (strain ATCC 10597 / BCRC 20456 / CBS 421 / NBRC 0211 / NRRL Y-12639) TaxID=1071378 RepID=G0WEA7_NAUDC|nr:hypothetical protein NDAI_0G03410 [Naumovozyma dairenensis CBS 421]CCD26118.2 hypothetical protein NDAI_0G03410 [Naumovozyma dairenensis CBS 421]